MRDLAFIAFIGMLLTFGLKRPFLFVLAYAYVDIVSPQRLSYYLLNSVPISMIMAGLAPKPPAPRWERQLCEKAGPRACALRTYRVPRTEYASDGPTSHPNVPDVSG